MSGISYDLTNIKGIVFDIDGVLSPTVIPIDDYGKPLRMMNVKDGYAILRAIKKGFKIAIISGGTEEKVLKRFESIGVKDIFCNVSHKLPVLLDWMDKQKLSSEEVAYMGDDIPDLQCMRSVGLSCAPYDAAREVLEEAKFISKFTGGYGCARDIIQQILSANNLWITDDSDYIW